MSGIFDTPQERKSGGTGGSSAFDDVEDLETPDIEDALEQLDQAVEEPVYRGCGCGGDRSMTPWDD